MLSPSNILNRRKKGRTLCSRNGEKMPIDEAHWWSACKAGLWEWSELQAKVKEKREREKEREERLQHGHDEEEDDALCGGCGVLFDREQLEECGTRNQLYHRGC